MIETSSLQEMLSNIKAKMAELYLCQELELVRVALDKLIIASQHLEVTSFLVKVLRLLDKLIPWMKTE
jgi:hypothetical protein